MDEPLIRPVTGREAELLEEIRGLRHTVCLLLTALAFLHEVLLPATDAAVADARVERDEAVERAMQVSGAANMALVDLAEVRKVMLAASAQLRRSVG